ncbi:MAG: galactose mutarotase [Bacilli bacterium]|nr:galactose mutarotase [Bacilli bacterium]
MKRTIKLINNMGMKVTLSPFGAAILDIVITMKDGCERMVTLRPKSLADFASSSGYYGKTIGRVAGRLEKNRCHIDGGEYTVLETLPNNGLHGGNKGLSNAYFDYINYRDPRGQIAIFSYQIPHLEDGLPGNLQVFVTYLLHLDRNRLEIRYEAKSDADTICNLTNHTYFNLDGQGTILDHELMINATRFAEVDERLIPTRVVDVTPVMDFLRPKRIGDSITARELSGVAQGYDHPYILNESNLQNSSASLTSSNNDLSLNMYTTYPCLVFYSGNYPTNENMIPTKRMPKHGALALEPQYLPNAINNPFGQEKTGLLKAGSLYQESIIYEFIIK